mgnify:CR=1 FL=1
MRIHILISLLLALFICSQVNNISSAQPDTSNTNKTYNRCICPNNQKAFFYVLNGIGRCSCHHINGVSIFQSAYKYKPAIYLYTSTPQKVNIEYKSNVNFSASAPKYIKNKGWEVLVDSSGRLTDMQSKHTNCNEINSNQLGFENASNACKTNSYHRIYAEGIRIGYKFPSENKGWLVAPENLNSFFNARLTELGLNSREKKDFIDYWVPVLSAKNAKAYKIYFLQDNDINRLIPLKISPTPNSLNRVYMIADTLYKTSNTRITPQKLVPVKRTSFTVLELGGEIR